MSPNHYDLIVVGAGQAGGPLAGAFAKAGSRVALVEQAHVGGTCVNVGCTPTKTMVASARVAHLTRRAAEYGVGVEWTGLDLEKVVERKQEVVSSFRSGSLRGLEDSGVEIVRGSGRFTGPMVLAVDGDSGTTLLTADKIVINTGLSPAIPPIKGLEGVSYLTSTTIMELDSVPEHLIIIGGGVIGLEFGQMFHRFGSRVTILQRNGQLLPREDRDIAESLTEALVADGIVVECDARVEHVSGSAGEISIEVGVGGTMRTVSGTHLLVATGRRPNTDTLALKLAGVKTTRRGHVKVNSKLETSASNVYAVGDVTGGPAFTHISYDDFRILRTNLLEGGNASTRSRMVPYTVFTDPQLGRVGLTEREARERGIAIRVATLPMTHVARAIETNETGGMMKAVVDAKTERIIGAAVVGTEGGEVASVLQVAMMGKLKYQAIRDGVFSHPTYAESLNNLFMTL